MFEVVVGIACAVGVVGKGSLEDAFDNIPEEAVCGVVDSCYCAAEGLREAGTVVFEAAISIAYISQV